MAQFDVHRNPGRHRDSIPFVVIVQSTLYDDYRRRVVVPLVNKSSLGLSGSRASRSSCTPSRLFPLPGRILGSKSDRWRKRAIKSSLLQVLLERTRR
jgi:hypothetical protein